MAQTETETQPTIERIERPTRAEFETEWVARNKPVILTGVASAWPAVERWSPDYLREVAGESLVTVHFEEKGDFHNWYGAKRRVDLRMPLGEFVDLLTREPPERRYYMTEHDLRPVSEQLCADLDASAYVDRPSPFLFLGRDTKMPVHYHGTTEAILCQILGTKEVTLYSPAQWRLLYAHPWYTRRYYFGRVDPRNPDLQRFPRFRKAKPLTFTLHPGEILFIPVQWWHVTRCSGFQANCTFFWPSRQDRYTWPSPGLQVRAHNMLEKVALRPLDTVKLRLKSLLGR